MTELKNTLKDAAAEIYSYGNVTSHEDYPNYLKKRAGTNFQKTVELPSYEEFLELPKKEQLKKIDLISNDIVGAHLPPGMAGQLLSTDKIVDIFNEKKSGHKELARIYKDIKVRNEKRKDFQLKYKSSWGVDIIEYKIIEKESTPGDKKYKNVTITNKYKDFSVVGSGSSEKMKLPEETGMDLKDKKEVNIRFSPDRTGDGQKLSDEEIELYLDNVIKNRIQNGNDLAPKFFSRIFNDN